MFWLYAEVTNNLIVFVVAALGFHWLLVVFLWFYTVLAMLYITPIASLIMCRCGAVIYCLLSRIGAVPWLVLYFLFPVLWDGALAV